MCRDPFYFFFIFQCCYCFCTFLKVSYKSPSSCHSTIYRELSWSVYPAQCMPITLSQRDTCSSVSKFSTMFNAFDVHKGNSFLNRNKIKRLPLAQQYILQKDSHPLIWSLAESSPSPSHHWSNELSPLCMPLFVLGPYVSCETKFFFFRADANTDYL